MIIRGFIWIVALFLLFSAGTYYLVEDWNRAFYALIAGMTQIILLIGLDVQDIKDKLYE